MNNQASTETTKEEIKQRLRDQIAPLRANLERIEDAERKAQSVALVGRCFKYRNSYSCPQGPKDYWWLYVKVVGIGEHWPVSMEFETDRDGKIEIRTRECFSRFEGHDEIKPSEFNAAWRSLQKRVAGMKP